MTLREFAARLKDMDFERRHALGFLAWGLAAVAFVALTAPAGPIALAAAAALYLYARVLRLAVRADLAERDARVAREMWVASESRGVDDELNEILGR